MDIQKLKELALEATPGPWGWSHQGGEGFCFSYTSSQKTIGAIRSVMTEPNILSRAMSESDAQFVAAANPSAIRELIAQRDALLAFAQSFEFTGPDDNGCVWLKLTSKNHTGKGPVVVGPTTMVVAQVAKIVEFDRQSAVALATGGVV